jgi:hypothetical protein
MEGSKGPECLRKAQPAEPANNGTPPADLPGPGMTRQGRGLTRQGK